MRRACRYAVGVRRNATLAPGLVGAALSIIAMGGACSSFSGAARPEDGGTLDVIELEGGPVDAIVDVSAGSASACAVRASGKLYCWGNNASHELGVENGEGACGGQNCSSAPILVPDLNDVERVSVGQSVACAVRRNGDVVCWGSNGQGHAGGAVTTDLFPPSRIMGLPKAFEVATTQDAACARVQGEATTEVWCWGKNTSGLIGVPVDFNVYAPRRIAGIDGAKALRLSPNTSQACVINGDDTVSCWGRNDSGILGHPPYTGADTSCATSAACSNVPSRVGTSFKVDVLAVGFNFACARRLGEGVSCWGSNVSGSLGLPPDPISRHTPVDIAILPKVLDLDVGGGHACARVERGELFCWGLNSEGELGNGYLGGSCASAESPCVPSPTRVEGLGAIARVSLGQYVTFAIDESGAAWAWGYNSVGQLAHPTGKAPDVNCSMNGFCSPRPTPLLIP
jgi:alpha-tubulin suppressor-like RCC1 family protein